MKQIEVQSFEEVSGMFTIHFSPFCDDRGYLFKYFTPQHFSAIREDIVWRQVIVQQTAQKNTIRGIHAQAHPFVESKLLVPLKGKMFWVCVDLRKDSSTFGQWKSMVLDAQKPIGLYVERGFAHGCCSLEDNTELLILADNDFAQGLGIHYADPKINIQWPSFDEEVVISDAHKQLGSLDDFIQEYGGL